MYFKSGEPQFRIVQRRQDTAGDFSIKKTYEPKSYDYAKTLLSKTILQRQDPTIKMRDQEFELEVPSLPKNIYKTLVPKRSDIISSLKLN